MLIQLTNPLNVLTSCLDQILGLQVFGYCHGYDDTENILRTSLHSHLSDGSKLSVKVAGNNHFMFVDQLKLGEQTYGQKELVKFAPDMFDCPFREAIWSRYGVLVGNHARHPIEFLPGFVTAQWRFGRDWGVEPVAAEINPEHGERQDHRRRDIEADLKAARADFKATETWPLGHSREPIAEILAAFHTGQRFDAHLNLRNQGAIAGVSNDPHVELPCRIEDGEVHRAKVRFPDRITAEIERIGTCQQMLARCCASYDEDLLVEALKLDALMPKEEKTIRRLMREMIEFQKEWIFESR